MTSRKAARGGVATAAAADKLPADQIPADQIPADKIRADKIRADKIPARWRAGQRALRAVQVAFDVNEQVMEAVRSAAYQANLSTSDQIRMLLQLPVAKQIKRPRLTITLSDADYALLGERFALPEDDRLGIKERAAQALLAFADSQPARIRRAQKNATSHVQGKKRHE